MNCQAGCQGFYNSQIREGVIMGENIVTTVPAVTP